MNPNRRPFNSFIQPFMKQKILQTAKIYLKCKHTMDLMQHIIISSLRIVVVAVRRKREQKNPFIIFADFRHTVCTMCPAFEEIFERHFVASVYVKLFASNIPGVV